MSIVQELESRVACLPEQARNIAITTADQYEEAGSLLKVIKAIRQRIDDTFKPITKKAHDAWKESLRQREKVEAPLIEAEAILKPRIAEYLTEEERKHLEEERRLQKLAAEEAERRHLEEAAMLDDMGDTESANAILEEAPSVPIIRVSLPVPKVSGIAMSSRWSAQVVNFMELVKAVAAGRAPIQCLKADQVFLNRQAVAMKRALNYPGVRAIEEKNISARSER